MNMLNVPGSEFNLGLDLDLKLDLQLDNKNFAPDGSEANPCNDNTRTQHPQLHTPEPLVAKTNCSDDKASCHQDQP